MSDGRAAGGAASLPIALFADLDGTLIEIAETPDGVVVPAALRDELAAAARVLDGAVAIVSGREIENVDALLDPLRLPVAGSHGARRRRADGSIADISPETVAIADAIAERLASIAQSDPRLLLERKHGAVALHYRRAPDKAQACREAVAAAIAGVEDFRLLVGKMVVEARPAAIDKGGAVHAFMAEPPFAGRVPVFLGDDTTDEDGFRAVQDLGGVGIKIGPGPSTARGRLPDVATARAFLRRIGEGLPFVPSTERQVANA